LTTEFSAVLRFPFFYELGEDFVLASVITNPIHMGSDVKTGCAVCSWGGIPSVHAIALPGVGTLPGGKHQQ